MKRILLLVLLMAAIIATLTQCNSSMHSKTETVKFQPNDPFKNTVVPSQDFKVDAKQDNVIEGKNGTVIVCPKGCFKNAKGEIVEGNVKIELAEALSLSDMLLSNLTTTSDGKPLETGGMIYFNVTANGEQLTINKDIPIHIQIATTDKKAGMMAYKGVRDENGNMNWIEPRELDKFLVTVDLNLLDFLPEGFQAEVDKGMPFKNHTVSTKELTDSLYYSLSVLGGSDLTKGFVPTNYNEAIYNKDKQIKDGKYTKGSFSVTSADTSKKLPYSNDSIKTKSNCGIDPAIIKVIKSEKYQNTFIATREFEIRLKEIFKDCKNSTLEFYLNNLDKNLWEVDSMVAVLGGEGSYKIFEDFCKQRLTKVKDADKYSGLLKGYYDKQLSKVKSDLEKTREKFSKLLDKKNEEAQKVADEYRNLLWEREKYRKETYGYTWSETGWINIDRGTMVTGTEKKNRPIQITVNDGKKYNRVYTYIVNTSINGLHRLNTTTNEQFYIGDHRDISTLIPDEKYAVAIAIGYKGEIPSLAIKEFETSESSLSLDLKISTLDAVRMELKKYENRKTADSFSYSLDGVPKTIRADKFTKAANSIENDLEFMTKFFKEEKRQKELIKESEFIGKLRAIAYPCCKPEEPEAPAPRDLK